MISFFSKKFGILKTTLSTNSIQKAWPNPSHSPPCKNLEENTLEMMMLFARRRELMYQVSILTVVGASILHLDSKPDHIEHLNLPPNFLVLSFLGASSILFCLRFIQLHLGILYHGIQFAFFECTIKNISDYDKLQCAGSAMKLNLRGVSFSVIFFFALLSSLCLSAGIYALFDSNLASAIAFTISVALLLLWTYFCHKDVARKAFDDFKSTAGNSSIGDESKLREHYRLSLAATHSDMICFTAIAAAQTLSNFEIIGWLDEQMSAGHPFSKLGLVLYSFISLLLGIMTARSYARQEIAVKIFSSSLGLSVDKLFKWSLSDIGIGYLVTSFFSGINMALFVFFSVQYLSNVSMESPIPRVYQEWFGICCGLLLVIFFMIRRSLRNLSNT